MDKPFILKGLKQREHYFQSHIVDWELFRPEYEVSSKINTIIESLNEMSKDDAQNIIELVNSLNAIEHYDGSGWLDYKIQLSAYLRSCGFANELNDRKMRLT